MKNIKLKNSNLCFIVLFAPVIIITLLGFVAMLIFNEEIGVPCLFVAMILDLIYLIKNFVEIMSIGLVVEQIGNWKKTRLWFAVGEDGENAQEITQRITAKCESHGKERQVRATCPELVSVRYRRYHSWTGDVAATEKDILLYRTDYLDGDTYRRIMTSAKSAVKEMKCKVTDLKFLEKEQKKSPVLTAAAVIIIADQIDFNLPEKIRKTPEFDDTAVMPCAIDLSSKLCYFDGMKDISLGGSAPIKNRTIKLIIKTAFNGKLPLKNNENFDYDLIDRQLPEMTLAEMHKTFKEANAENSADAKRMGKTLRDGEERLKDDFLYLKRGERLAVYTVFEDEEDPSKIEISTNEFWSYPKRMKISKVDEEILKRRTENFFPNQKVVFIDEEVE